MHASSVALMGVPARADGACDPCCPPHAEMPKNSIADKDHASHERQRVIFEMAREDDV
jgi:hypothetical protein